MRFIMSYDEIFAKSKKRRSLQTVNTECSLCISHSINTVSDFEWPCLILEDWICEAHCSEIKLEEFTETHTMTRGLSKKILTINTCTNEDLLNICKQCPYVNF